MVMPMTYFCRINQRCDVQEQLVEDLWNDDRLAIHFPWLDGEERHPARPQPDTKSINPEEYAKSDRRAMRALVELARNAGYVCLEQTLTTGLRRTKVGFVPAGTEIELREGRWGSLPNRKAILKTLKMTRVRTLHRRIPSIEYGRPQQGTLMRWHRVNDLIARLVEGREPLKEFTSLAPTETEVLCSEYLRTRTDKLCLECLLAPVGRTMRSVDIWGLNPSGEEIVAQVTQGSDTGTITAKCAALAAFAGAGRHLVIFAPRNTLIPRSDITHLPLEDAFNHFLSKEAGKRWWQNLQQ